MLNFDRKDKVNEKGARILARRLAREIALEDMELINAGGAGCTESTCSSCDLDQYADVGFGE